MEIRQRAQPSQFRGFNYNDCEVYKLRFSGDGQSSSFCSVLKLAIFVFGLFNLFLVLVINSWKQIEPPSVVYSRNILTIEEYKSYSDLVNYAADFNGAVVTKTHQEEYVDFFKYVINQGQNAPENAISLDNNIGKCWGFDGHKGFLHIKLQKPIYPLHFTIKHTNSINFDSAPKEFCLYRLEEFPIILGCYDFFLSKARPNPDFTQTFPCLSNCDKPAQNIKLEILSNNGGEVTCLYQILIHGDPITLNY